ncbi:MAG: biotin transporter BioY [Clostridia bacterium]|nr:biotin transporter BioY [Clostridia bacterium]
MTRLKTRDGLYTAMFSALIAICAWIAVPGAVPFTMQTFAVFLAAALLGGKRAAVSVAVYMLVGILGLPVFSGGQGGVGTLFGTTGGYIIGFLPCAYIAGKLCEKTKKRPLAMAFSMLAGLLCDYIFGLAWFCLVYSRGDFNSGLWNMAISITAPFVFPDIAKIILACIVSLRFQKIR